jgi:CheY-like chemotaxis protein
MSKPGKRVLIVDDNHDVLDAMAMFVTSIGHLAESVPGGIEALEKLEFGRFDVVLTDLMMPGMSGQELAREIRKRRPALPVVLMSVSPPRYPSDDIAGVLHKPFSLAELSSAIEAVC